MRRKHLITLLAFVGTVMIFGSAESFHQKAENPDPQKRAAHAVNKDCRILQHSDITLQRSYAGTISLPSLMNEILQSSVLWGSSITILTAQFMLGLTVSLQIPVYVGGRMKWFPR